MQSQSYFPSQPNSKGYYQRADDYGSQTPQTEGAGMSPSVHQTSYALMCRVLRQMLRDAVQAGSGAAGGIGTVECQAVAALYLLLMDHSIDQRGRCRSCRRPGAVFGLRWRCCRVYVKASLWLRQPEEVLLRLLAHELGLAAATPPTDPLPTPAVPSTPIPPAGRPDLDHGGTGDDLPESPRPRRVPSENPRVAR